MMTALAYGLWVVLIAVGVSLIADARRDRAKPLVPAFGLPRLREIGEALAEIGHKIAPDGWWHSKPRR